MATSPSLPERAGVTSFRVAAIGVDAPWRWLALGWRDLWAAPRVSLLYGGLFFLVSLAVTWGLFSLEAAAVAPAAAAGFMLVGPVLAVGLYETSRRLERGERASLRAALGALLKSSSQMRFMGVMLMIILLAWMRIATLLFALFFGTAYPSLHQFIPALFMTSNGLGLLAVGTAFGAFFALTAFATAAVSTPLLMVRDDVDAITAMVTSFEAIRRNLVPMLVWAWLIVVVMAVGVVTLYAGLIIAFPLIGHATWHAYRELLPDATA